MIKLENFFKEVGNWLISRPPVGGLVVQDAGLYYLDLDRSSGSVRSQSSLRLPPGIVKDGKIINRPNFIAALKALKTRIRRGDEIINIVLSLPIQAVYIQSFYVPAFAERDLEEAAELNLKMISPIESAEAYYDWQKINSEIGADGRIELLGAFVEKKLVDDYASALEEAGYGVAAVECYSLSLLRSFLLREREAASSELLISISADGVNYLISQKGKLFFHYFADWSDGGDFSPARVENRLTERIQQIVNFYLSHTGKKIDRLLIIASQLGPELAASFQASFPEISVRVLGPGEVNALYGAAMREADSAETNIDLGGPTSFRLYEEERIIHFSSFWRNTALTIGMIIVALYLGSYYFLNNFAKGVVASNANTAVSASLANLENQANDFNNLVADNRSAANASAHFSPLINKLDALAGQKITFTSISISGVNQPVSIKGSAASEDAITNFNASLSKLTQITNLNFPLSGLMTQPDGTISFSLSFTPTSLNF